MNENNVENKIYEAFENASPNILDSVIADSKTEKGQVIQMKEKKTNFKPIIAVAACFVLLFVGVFGVTGLVKNNKTVTKVALDVNPSIELEVNAKDKIVNVNAINDDAKKILGDMDLEGSDLEVAVNALVGAMLRNGYLSELSNSILVSVENDDAKTNEALQTKLTAMIEDILKGGNIEPAVISQQVVENQDLKSLATKNGVSSGKVQLVQEIVKADPTKSFDELIGLKVNELYLIIEGLEDAGKISDATEDKLEALVTGIACKGRASEKAYITRDKALEIALATAKVSKADISSYEIEFDCDHGTIVFEVELTINGEDYEFEINATTGELVTAENPIVPAQKGQQNQGVTSGTTGTGNGNATTAGSGTGTQYHGGAIAKVAAGVAKNTALAHAGFNATEVTNLTVKLEQEDNGTYEYDVEFVVGTTEYSYEINAETGTIIDFEKEPIYE